MTKIGEGKEVPREPTVEGYQKDVDKNAAKFLNALDQYQAAGDDEERAHFKAVMDQSLALIRAAVSEIKRDGLGKQEGNVEKDYQTYIKDQTPQNLSALQEDVSDFRDNNNKP